MVCVCMLLLFVRAIALCVFDCRVCHLCDVSSCLRDVMMRVCACVLGVRAML